MKTVALLLILLTFVACQLDKKPDTKAINKRILSGDFDMYEELDICRCDSLKIDSLNTYFRDDSLYTGVCFLTYPESKKKSEVRQIFKGLLHGNHIELSKKGDTISQSIYNLGELKSKRTKEMITCHCDSLKENTNRDEDKRMYYLEIPFTGTCNRFFPLPDTNKIYLKMQYQNGLVHGDMIIYNRQGKEVLTEFYEEGQKVVK